MMLISRTAFVATFLLLAESRNVFRVKRAEAGVWYTPQGGSVIDVYAGSTMSDVMVATIQQYESQGFNITVITDGEGGRKMTATYKSPIVPVGASGASQIAKLPMNAAGGATTTKPATTSKTASGVEARKPGSSTAGRVSTTRGTAAPASKSTTARPTGMAINPIMQKLPEGVWTTTKDKSVITLYPGTLADSLKTAIKAHEAKGLKVEITGTGGFTTNFKYTADRIDPSKAPFGVSSSGIGSMTGSGSVASTASHGSSGTGVGSFSGGGSSTSSAGSGTSNGVPQGEWVSKPGKSVVDLYPGALPAKTQADIHAHEAMGYQVKLNGRGTQTRIAYLPDPIA